MRILFFLFALTTFLHAAIDEKRQDDVKICLTMIVKNEHKTIERCLNKVVGIIDCFSIVDMGSSDNTRRIIEHFMRRHDIPGKVHRHNWENFGKNRTLAVQEAQKTIAELGFALPDVYLLILDADMKVDISATFNKNELIDDSYLLLKKSSDLSSYTPHFLRASLPWESIGVANEYWYCKEPYQSAKLQTVTIEEQDIAGLKDAKPKNAIMLLTVALKDEPDNKRYQFHLAQSLKQVKNFDEAIKWYKTRIEKDGDKEEVWFSKYMIGECYEELGQWEPALYWYLEAYQYNPDRVESLRKIATYYRLHGECDLAYLFAKHALQIPFSNDQLSFVAQSVYDYQLDEELSIAAYYTRFKEDGIDAANRIILKKNVPWHIKDQTYKNILFYIQNLKNTHFQPVTIELPPASEGSKLTYNPMNPSIKKIEDGYAFICRTVNFTLHNGVYATIDPHDKTIRTKNFLVHYDRDFNIISQKEIVENLPRVKLKPSFDIEGLEDCRIFELNNDYWFTCTTFDTNPYGPCQISLCKLEDEESSSTTNVKQLVPLKGPDPHRYEKNWLPFIYQNELCVVYSYDPFIIYRPNTKTGECEIVLRRETKYDFSHFRGSAAPIAFDNGYLILVHEVVQLANNSRCYLHRFIYLDENFNITRASKPFSYQHLGVEYCCSMTIDHSGTKLIMPIGIEDREAYLCIVDLDTVRSLLTPLAP